MADSHDRQCIAELTSKRFYVHNDDGVARFTCVADVVQYGDVQEAIVGRVHALLVLIGGVQDQGEGGQHGFDDHKLQRQPLAPPDKSRRQSRQMQEKGAAQPVEGGVRNTT